MRNAGYSEEKIAIAMEGNTKEGRDGYRQIFHDTALVLSRQMSSISYCAVPVAALRLLVRTKAAAKNNLTELKHQNKIYFNTE